MKTGNIHSLLTRYSDLLLATGVIGIVGLLLIPIPHFLLDILLTINISIAVTILMVTIYVQNATRFASFPTLLLITTLFRLGLNVSTTRLVLAKGYAGEVVEAFGNFVTAGNLVVGFVIFLILTVIQFIVITKGSERVAEVAARFTLDAMPGKQMSIDADLRSGAMTLDDARAKRAALQRESQLYGAMDGAMKFVKGDAIAGIIITLINIIGGLAIGVAQRHMEFAKALKTYTIMTVGDGLVSQLPALLISIAAGVVVTRVASEDESTNLGKDIGTQILAQPRAIAIVSVLLFVLGLVPGLPKVPFFVMSAITGFLAFGLIRAEKKEAAATAAAEQKSAEGDDPQLSFAVPILVQVSESLTAVIDKDGDGGQELQRLIPELRDSLYYELGVLVPPIKIRGNLPIGDDAFAIQLKEVPVVQAKIPRGKLLVAEAAENLFIFQIEAEAVVNPANGMPAAWVPESAREIVETAGIKVFTAPEVLVLHIAGFLKKYAWEFVGLQETQTMLDQMGQAYPKLVEEVVPKVVSLYQLTEVLQRLVREGISIRDLKGILEALSEWGRIESDPLALTELVRSSMGRQICFRYARPDGRLICYQVDPEIQQTVAESIRHTSTGKYISLAPDIQGEILSAIRSQLAHRPATAGRAVVLTEPEVRPYFRRLVELDYPDAAVISLRELTTEVLPQPIGVIALGGRR
ncbi:MAG: type III secretion system export apparatus subunit SctV [Candidatus Eisenbacteria bacterium]|nr:type III secretion system export apparatus subunit SctV [Candidatus Eisenbacteria bacterium]